VNYVAVCFHCDRRWESVWPTTQTVCGDCHHAGHRSPAWSCERCAEDGKKLREKIGGGEHTALDSPQ
jgi:hypothetical protein